MPRVRLKADDTGDNVPDASPLLGRTSTRSCGPSRWEGMGPGLLGTSVSSVLPSSPDSMSSQLQACKHSSVTKHGMVGAGRPMLTGG